MIAQEHGYGEIGTYSRGVAHQGVVDMRSVSHSGFIATDERRSNGSRNGNALKQRVSLQAVQNELVDLILTRSCRFELEILLDPLRSKSRRGAPVLEFGPLQILIYTLEL